MATFPLQRLPWLAFCEVIQNFCVLSFVNLIQCSKKFTETLKLTDPDRLIVSLKLDCKTLCFGSFFRIEMKPPDKMWLFGYYGDVWTFKSTPIHYRCRCVSRSCIVYTEDEKQLALDLWYFILEYLDVDFGTITFDTIEMSRVESVINHIASKRSSMEFLKVAGEGINVNWILGKVKVTKELAIKTKLDEDFELKLSNHQKLFKIYNSSWLKLDYLLTLDCVLIELRESLLTNQDISLYVDQWRKGKFPKLRSLVVRGRHLTDSEPISGVPPPIRTGYKDPNEDEDEDEIRIDEAWIYNNFLVVRNGVEIRSDDGAKAVIRMDIACKTFRLLVLDEYYPVDYSERRTDSYILF